MSFNGRCRGLHADDSDVSMLLKVVGALRQETLIGSEGGAGQRTASCEPN